MRSPFIHVGVELLSRRLGLAVVALSMVLSARSDGVENSRCNELKTEHYDLEVRGTDADEIGKLIEKLYARLNEFFAKEPRERLRVRVFSDRAEFSAAIEKDGNPLGPIDQTLGRYIAKTRTVYAVMSPNDRYTSEATVLHECTHQFHLMACTQNRPPRSGYYREGLALHFEMHRWDGPDPGIAEVPDISGASRAVDALASFSTLHHGDFRTLATDPSFSPDYGEAWGLVSFLIAEEPVAYRKWSASLDAIATPQAAWDAAFAGRSTEQLSARYVAWLKAHQSPWLVLRGLWDSRAYHVLTATSEQSKWALAQTNPQRRWLRFSAEATSPEAELAIVFINPDTNVPYHILKVNAAGEVWLTAYFHYEGLPPEGKLVKGLHVKDRRKLRLEARRDGDLVKAYIDDAKAIEMRMPTDVVLGPAVYSGSAKFTDVKTGDGPMLFPDETPPLAVASSPQALDDRHWSILLPSAGAVLAGLVGLPVWLWTRRRRALDRCNQTDDLNTLLKDT